MKYERKIQIEVESPNMAFDPQILTFLSEHSSWENAFQEISEIINEENT